MLCYFAHCLKIEKNIYWVELQITAFTTVFFIVFQHQTAKHGRPWCSPLQTAGALFYLLAGLLVGCVTPVRQFETLEL